jgi:hypothetical protein
MADEQSHLVASFPRFIETIRSTVAVEDWQIMVVDTDPFTSFDLDMCKSACAAIPFGGCSNIPCGRILSGGPMECGVQNGAGLTTDQNGGDCGIVGGHRFLTSAQPDLPTAFNCVATVGTKGNGDEMPMQSLGVATSPERVGTGGCNEGFLREDAILVVTFITDEEDDHIPPAPGLQGGSPGEPMDWKATLVANKGGREDAIVVLGLIGDSDIGGGTCAPLDASSGVGADGAVRLRTFVESFGNRGLWGSVCAADYAPFFEQAVALVDTTCDDFVPPG